MNSSHVFCTLCKARTLKKIFIQNKGKCLNCNQESSPKLFYSGVYTVLKCHECFRRVLSFDKYCQNCGQLVYRTLEKNREQAQNLRGCNQESSPKLFYSGVYTVLKCHDCFRRVLSFDNYCQNCGQLVYRTLEKNKEQAQKGC